MHLYLVFCLSSFALFACAKNHVVPPPESEALPASLGNFVLELQRSEGANACESTYQEEQTALIQALDERFEDIRQFMLDHPPTGFKTVELGALSVQEQLEFEPGEDEWKSRHIGWQRFIDIWKEIKDTPVDANWVNLNGGVRGILMDDQIRIKDGYNYGITRDQAPYLKGLEETIRDCLVTEGCLTPNFSAAQNKVIAANPMYTDFKNTLTGQSTGETLTKWVDQITKDLFRFETRVYPSATFSGSVLEVPLFSGQLAEAEGALSEYIESVWKNDDLQVRIKWLDKKMDNKFTFVLDNDVGGRAFVRWSDNSIHVSDGVTSRTFPHEFGHILGLNDQYYTSWDPQKCWYVVEQNAGNIMSTTSSGLATPELFAFLGKTYGKN
ncbi:MAG: hypothetical protein AB7T49_11350 [Oligoflexales bacterium]